MQPRIARSLGIDIASPEATERVRALRPDNIWAIRTGPGGVLSGLYAMLMLSQSGKEALIDGSINALDPAREHLAGPGEPVAAIYKWTIFAPGRAAAAIPLMAEKLREPAYAAADLFGVGITAAGRRIMERLGFEPYRTTTDRTLFRYERRINRHNPQMSERQE